MTTTTTTTVMVVLMMVAQVTTTATTSTFVAVTQDMAPPPSPNTTTTDTSLAQCSERCHSAGVGRCLAFVWRPVPSSPSQVQVTAATIDNNTSSSSSEGKCELLPCLPHPASLTPFLGAHLFVLKLPDSTTPPPHFTHSLVPLKYSMGCTFAFRVYGSEKVVYRQAERRCALDRARLVVFKSGEEEKVVTRDITTSQGYWIGHTDRQRRWADRPDLIYTNWGEGQPNNHLHETSDQFCVMLLEGRWSDRVCQEDLHFICQVPLLHP